jgi:hypothetical protein
MIDERFALREFVARGRNSPASDELAQQLQVAIAKEVLPEVRRLAESIASKLGKLGHQVSELEFELEEQVGSVGITFADTSEGTERAHHRLRFNLDLLVSAGFPGYRDE